MSDAPWIAWRAARTPDAPAVVAEGTELSWAVLAEASAGLAERLAALGVARGDVVASRLPTGTIAVGLLHAVDRLGATWLPLNTRLAADELAALLAAAAPRVLVAEDGALEERPGVRRSETTGEDDPPLALIGTSGTTGAPRLVELPRAALHASAEASATVIAATSADRWLASLPLYHVGGLAILTRSVLVGSAVVLPRACASRGFDPTAFAAGLERDAVTVASVVPTMLRRLLDENVRAPGSLRCVLLGGGPIPEELVARAWGGGWPVVPTYGLTEACSQVATLPHAEIGCAAPGSGRPLPGTDVSIHDARGRAVAAGEVGEIRVRTATAMRGYRGDPEATARKLVDGVLRTGDLGWLDARGHLHVVDRLDHRIVTGGENVYPAEVEAVLEEHPAVAEVAVVGEPDPDLGHRVVAWIVPSGEPAPTVDALREWGGERLARYKLPRTVHVTDALPRTGSGKVRRRALLARR